MKVILIDEIRGLGGRGDVVQVKDGYARNYLIPKKLARQATAGNLKAAEQERKKWDLLTNQEKDLASKAAEKISGMKIVVHKRVGEQGTLFGSVTASDIADQLEAKGIEIDKRRIELAHPIKTAGIHDVEIKLHREVFAHIQVEVLGEGQHPSSPAAAQTAPAATDQAESEQAAPPVEESAASDAAAPQ
ncbi:MAG: 50S ribosomal protein L9 [Acidobacteriota bacterium]